MTTRISVVENILSANDRIAQRNREMLDQLGVYAINIMASPGAGKTSFILKTLEALNGRLKLGVIEGDLATSIDAEKAMAAGLPAVQINTGGECHLDAVMLADALPALPLGGCRKRRKSGLPCKLPNWNALKCVDRLHSGRGR